MKKLVAFLLLAAAASGGWWYFTKHTETAPQAATLSATEERAIVEQRNIEFNIEVSGDVAPTSLLEVKSEVSGKIKTLNVQPGQVVKKGDILLEIDDRDLQTEKQTVLTEIEGAKLSLAKTRRNFERSAELHKQKLISQEVYDNLNSDFQIAENTLAKSERRLAIVDDKLDKTKVTAPTDGTVLTVPVVQGQVIVAAASVNSGSLLMTIADLTKLQVETHVNQVDVARLSLNQKVKLRSDSLADLELDATISHISPSATTKNSVKGFAVEAIIATKSAVLRPGMTVQMRVPIARADDAVAVPVSAVFKGENNTRLVWVAGDHGPEKREVKVGISNFDHAQILKGVKVGEEILLQEPKKTGKRS